MCDQRAAAGGRVTVHITPCYLDSQAVKDGRQKVACQDHIGKPPEQLKSISLPWWHWARTGWRAWLVSVSSRRRCIMQRRTALSTPYILSLLLIIEKTTFTARASIFFFSLYRQPWVSISRLLATGRPPTMRDVQQLDSGLGSRDATLWPWHWTWGLLRAWENSWKEQTQTNRHQGVGKIE